MPGPRVDPVAGAEGPSPAKPTGGLCGAGWLRLALILASLVLPGAAGAAHAEELKFRIGDWVTECGAAGCSITGLFQQTNLNGRRGAFALVVLLGSRQLAVVGDPHPTRARLQIDANNPTACTGTRYCIFSGPEAGQAIRELASGSLVLLDVQTRQDVFRASLSTKGYQASLAELEAEGYRIPAIWAPPVQAFRDGRSARPKALLPFPSRQARN